MKLIDSPFRAKTLGVVSVLLTTLVLADTGHAEGGPLRATVAAPLAAASQSNRLKPRRINSLTHLKQMLSAKSVHAGNMLSMVKFMPTAELRVADAGAVNLSTSSSDFASLAGSTSSVGYSETNVQVQGVDEGDSVKTDGQYLYTIQSGMVRIVKAYPAETMTTVATLKFDNGFSPAELYVEGEQLVVIGSSWLAADSSNTATDGQAKMSLWAPAGESRTVALIYNITDRANPQIQRQVSFSSSLLSSRMIGKDVYVIGRNYPNYFMYGWGGMVFAATAESAQNTMTKDNLLPHIADSAVKKGEDKTLALSSVYYFPGFVEPDYVIVAGFNLDKLTQPVDVKAYLGGGETVYASAKNLYVSAADYSTPETDDKTAPLPKTHLYKFALDAGKTEFLSGGEVPGTVLNQFSMDEYNGYFRIATTVDQWTQSGDTFNHQNWNNLYTLDSNMKVAGRLEHLAEGERIYSARFMGDRSYLVTFRQTDPLFVIDLSKPDNPGILGQLKIPGFSNYLHPYDNDHIIGIGQDTQENEFGGAATSGMKLALFDVSNVAKPVELHNLKIGERGTYSPLLWGDHHALLFDKKRGIMSFPISETAKVEGQDWPAQVFQGAYVYKISLEKGFEKQAAISHMTDQQSYYDWYHTINRVLTIDDDLYTLSELRIQANDLTTFKQTGALDFPAPEWWGCGTTIDANGCSLVFTAPVLAD